MPTLVDVHMDLLRASDAVMALEDRLQQGEVVDATEYDEALVPFKACLDLAKDKTDRYAEFLLFVRKQAEYRKDLAAMETRRAKAAEALAGRLEELARFAIRCTDANFIEGNRRKIALQANSVESVVIKRPDELPAWCYPPQREPSKSLVAIGVKDGRIPSEVAVMERGEHLRIK